MAPISNITEIAAGVIINDTETLREAGINFTSIIGKFFIYLGLVCGCIFLLIWFTILVIAIYQTLKDDIRHLRMLHDTKMDSMHNSKGKGPSTQLNIYMVPGNEGTKKMAIDGNIGSKNENVTKSLIESSGSNNYGTISSVDLEQPVNVQKKGTARTR
ncbi:hypothetical protein EYC84_009227 [Monilinia fructicola]|uniref:Uncharacterized protein n=1 Tax=Monilinia fructicola TaxID=38448 RepID=A0A5M9JBH9_MONFR|nr:hypothetical protein EYC84_009227 [Monilinia fructicola]